MRRTRVLIWAWALLGSSLAGCYSHDSYLLTRAQVDAIAQEQTAAAPDAIQAERVSDHKRVWVKTEALRQATGSASPQPAGDLVSVPLRAYSPKISAGAALTWIGTGISLVGTVLVAVGKIQDNNPLFYAGGITALAAEPLMWTGTGLWIAGALHPPFETAARAPAP